MEIPLQRRQRGRDRRLVLAVFRVPPSDLQKRVHHPLAISEGLLQLSSPPVSSLEDVAKGHSLTGQFLTDRTAKIAVLLKDAHLGDVARVVT